ncbi:hypothetical protein MRX96_003904 [Rhipicephalus microplus]
MAKPARPPFVRSPAPVIDERPFCGTLPRRSLADPAPDRGRQKGRITLVTARCPDSRTRVQIELVVAAVRRPRWKTSATPGREGSGTPVAAAAAGASP